MPCGYSAVADGELFYGSAIGHMAMVRAEVSWRAVAPLLGGGTPREPPLSASTSLLWISK
jgi:hypothetical protein